MLRWSVLLVLLVFCCSTAILAEVLMEVEFDLGSEQYLVDGYSSADAVTALLASEDLKWMRYFIPYVSGKQGHVRNRNAHFMFKDHAAWASFSQENMQKLNVLFDHFWVDTRRNVWATAEPEVIPGGLSIPKVLRAEGMDAGYIFQIAFSIMPGKENEYKNEWNRLIAPFINDLKNNPGFLERMHYIDQGFQPQYDHLVQYEFTSMQAMAQSMYGKAYSTMLNSLSKYVSSQAVTVLVPGADESFYWPGKGVDREGFGSGEL